jgi:arylsulfatase A-like enzyme
VDVLPTILDLVGVSIPVQLHGQSLLPVLLTDTPLHLEAYVEAFLRIRSDPRDRRIGWRTAEWKYIYAPQNPRLSEELYDLSKDPGERWNLASRRPEIAVALRNRIESLQQGPLAPSPGLAMSEAEKAAIEKRLTELGYL